MRYINVSYFELKTDINGKQFIVQEPCPYGLQVLAAAINNESEEEKEDA